MRIVSTRGRVLIARQEYKRRLEEKFLLKPIELTDAEKQKVDRLFDIIRRELEAIGAARA